MAIVLSESVLLLLVNLLLLLWINFLIISIIIPCIWWKYLEFSFGTSFGWCKFELLMQMPISFLKVNSCSYLVVLESFCIVTYFIINFLAHRCLLVFTLYYLAAFFWLVSFFEVGNISLIWQIQFLFFFFWVNHTMNILDSPSGHRQMMQIHYLWYADSNFSLFYIYTVIYFWNSFSFGFCNHIENLCLLLSGWLVLSLLGMVMDASIG